MQVDIADVATQAVDAVDAEVEVLALGRLGSVVFGGIGLTIAR
jgi:hypothetical protein